MKHFTPFTEVNLQRYLPKRFDLDLPENLEQEDTSPVYAQQVELAEDPGLWIEIKATYVIVGIPEDIGVRANMGRQGARDTWKEFLNIFLKLPHSEKSDASRFCILGHVQTADLIEDAKNLDQGIHEDRVRLSHAVSILDQRVSEVINAIKEADKIPVVIGGGHNNAYPLLSTYGYSQPIDCINIDAHTDLRNTKGRHSGNGFSHALDQGFLNKYFILGIQEHYLNHEMMRRIDSTDRISYAPLKTDSDLIFKDLQKALEHISTDYYGLEIDLDVIANFPSSAQSPVGMSLEQVKMILQYVLNGQYKKPRYIHICEGAPQYGYENQVGKAISYLMTTL